MEIEKSLRVDACQRAVWQTLTDVEAFERKADDMGIDLSRTDVGEVGVGSEWNAGVRLAGLGHNVTLTVTHFEAPAVLELTGRAGGLEGVLRVELNQSEADVTMMQTFLKIRPVSMQGKLFYKMLTLAEGKVSAKLDGFGLRIARKAMTHRI